MPYQKTFIKVDENGTEEAAATVVLLVGTGMPIIEEPKSFVADHPFTYYIIDPADSQVWFAGAVVK